MTLERWKPLEISSSYEVSNKGRVRSVDRIVTRTLINGTKVRQPLKGVVLSPSHCKNGYLYVSIKGKSYQVHRLVALTWIGGGGAGMDACHEDGDRHNNVVDNLSWKSRKDNLSDQLRHGTKLRGETQNGAKLTENDVIKMRELRDTTNYGWIKISRMFGVSPSTAKNAITGVTWKHVKQGAQPAILE